MIDYERTVKIGGRDLTESCGEISFEWIPEGGCGRSRLQLFGGGFDDFLGVENGDEVEILYSDSNPYYKGIVYDMETSFDETGRIDIVAVGLKTRLAETIPGGRYGTHVKTLPPAQMEISAENEDTDPGTSRNGEFNSDGSNPWVHYYIVSIGDNGKETASGTRKSGEPGGTDATRGDWLSVQPPANGRISLAWIETQTDPEYGVTREETGAVRYRIYRQIGQNPTPESGSWDWFETEAAEFTDENAHLVNTAASHTPGNEPNAGNGATRPTIDSATISDIVDHLLDTYLPDGVDKGTVSAGASDTIDDFDLTNSKDDLQKVLDSLATVVGNTIWGTDENGDVFFIPIDETTAAHTYTMKDAEQPISSTETDVVLAVSRKQTRDGISHVKIEGEEGLENEDAASRNITWDSQTLSNSIGAVNIESASDHRVVSMDVDDAAPAITPTRAFLDGYADLQAWLDDFPNLRWIFQLKDELSNAFIANYLQGVIDRRERIVTEPDNPEGLSKRRSGSALRNAVRRVSGVRTIKTAGIVAINWMLKYKPHPASWSIEIDLISDGIVKPSQGFVRLTTPLGKRYDIEVQGAEYTFGDTARLQLTGGDRIYTPEEEERDLRDVVRSLSFRSSDRFRAISKEPPRPVYFGGLVGGLSASGRSRIGTSEEAARADHEHPGVNLDKSVADLVDDANSETNAILPIHRLARVVHVRDDYLECEWVNPPHGVALEVNIAKPDLLRRTKWDNQSPIYWDGAQIGYVYDSFDPERKRTADDGQEVETQVVTPDYIDADVSTVHDEIVALRIDTGLTDALGDPILWLDTNNGGRAWAREVV